MSFRIPRKSPPNKAPAQRDAPFPESPNYILKIPSQWTPLVPQRAPTKMPFYRAFFYSFPSESPVNEHPPFSPPGFLWREKLHLQSQWFMHSFLSVTGSNKEPSHGKRGKHLVTVHGAPPRRKAYIQCGETWFLEGVVYVTAVPTSVPCSLQHDIFHLGLGRPEPR
jgi:hypothetical protein